MARWLIYLKERFPLPVYALLIGGLGSSGIYLESSTPQIERALWSVVALFLFFAELRLMDELKDFSKDCLAHPERPLPRGLLSRPDVSRAISILFVLMVALAIGMGLVLHPTVGLSYLVVSLYLWLMYREFYLGSRLSDYPLVYAISHQIILIPLCVFSVVVAEPEAWSHPSTLAFGFTVLGSFFAYEVCRKLDPSAHPILKTYLSTYGPVGTATLVVAATAVAALGAHSLGLNRLLLLPHGVLLTSLVLLFFRPRAFKWVEGAASVSLLIHVWAIPMHIFTGL